MHRADLFDSSEEQARFEASYRQDMEEYRPEYVIGWSALFVVVAVVSVIVYVVMKHHG